MYVQTEDNLFFYIYIFLSCIFLSKNMLLGSFVGFLRKRSQFQFSETLTVQHFSSFDTRVINFPISGRVSHWNTRLSNAMDHLNVMISLTSWEQCQQTQRVRIEILWHKNPSKNAKNWTCVMIVQTEVILAWPQMKLHRENQNLSRCFSRVKLKLSDWAAKCSSWHKLIS